MRSVLLTTVALLAVAATAAVAADLPRAVPARAPAYLPIGYNWTGFYVGINGGYAWGRSHWSSFAGNWTAKLEYLHVDLGHTNCALGACSLPARVGFHAETVRAGVNYRF